MGRPRKVDQDDILLQDAETSNVATLNDTTKRVSKTGEKRSRRSKAVVKFLEQLARTIEENGECEIALTNLRSKGKVASGFENRMTTAIDRICKAKWRKTSSGYSIETK
jgi:hypothetical protein